MKKRWEWLAKIIRKKEFRIGAELGVKKGRTTFYLLDQCPNLKMIAVDLWGKQPGKTGEAARYNTWNHTQIFSEFNAQAKKARYRKRLTVLRMLTSEAAKHVADNSLDFIFIDADHSYEGCKADIFNWTPKVKESGLITGHDIHFPGVKQAVEELFSDWKTAGIDHVWFAKPGDLVIPDKEDSVEVIS